MGAGHDMTWANLAWPDLSPEFPEPAVTRPAPERPDVPANIAGQVRTAERRRAAGVWLCVLTGASLCVAACVLYAVTLRASTSDGAASTMLARAAWPSLALLAAGLVAAFPAAALAALLLGPTWEQRRQHWRAERWQADYAHWLAIQRLAYMHALPPSSRTALSRRLGEDASRVAH